MTNLEFDDFIKEITMIFDKNMPNKERMKFLFEELKFIPREAKPYILDKFKSEVSSLPVNLIKAVKDFWYQYLRDNPQKLDRTHNCTCEDGFIYVVRELQGEYKCFASKCPKCRTEASSVYDLEASGAMVMSDKYRGDMVRFLADKGLAECELRKSQSELVQSVSARLNGYNRQIDKSRVQHLPQRELSRYKEQNLIYN